MQFHRGFTLRDALDRVPYLSALGVSHLYASPLLMARPGSTHGYDVCQPARINPELGTESDLEALVAALRERGMGLVLDIVPNHQGIGGRENPWWWDVLRHGRQSRFADHFDIDWDSADPRLRGKVLLPVLGDTLDRIIERGELTVGRENSEFVLCYFDRTFPLSPGSLPDSGAAGGSTLKTIDGDRQALGQLLDRQNYALLWWRLGDTHLNYRRFFTVTDLAGVRVELAHVFSDTHALILDWHRRGLLDGLRVDHPDGLRDPGAYFERLAQSAPDAWIIIEKILGPEEQLPSNWPVAGTTGYDFLGRLTALFVDPHSEAPLTDFYIRFTGESSAFHEVVRQKKRFFLRERLASEVTLLTRLVSGLAAGEDRTSAFTADALREALVELAACTPVYRTYIRADAAACTSSAADGPADLAEGIRETDVAIVETAIALARQAHPERKSTLAFLGDLLLGRVRREGSAEWVMRFQQLTGPAMAKGVEDTTFYCYNRFMALNEVGGDPGRFGLSVARFHEACSQTREHWPHAMLATSTHDTKRSEDVRARLEILSEIPERWSAAVGSWSAMNEPRRQGEWPDRNAEYLFYQTLVGAWPLALDRALAYMEKAVREAGQYTNWLDPNPEYEKALGEFVRESLVDPAFQDALERFVAPLVGPGRLNALAQTLLKLTTPGVPDVYQGTELWDLSLVDPDNRRTVDFALRQDALREMERRIEQDGLAASADGMLANSADGMIKLFVIHQTLQLRRREERLFREGEYVPLAVRGSRAEHVCAFARGLGGVTMVVVVPRLILGLADGQGGSTLGAQCWDDTALILPGRHTGREFHNVFTDELVAVREGCSHALLPLAELFSRFPIALGELLDPPTGR